MHISESSNKISYMKCIFLHLQTKYDYSIHEIMNKLPYESANTYMNKLNLMNWDSPACRSYSATKHLQFFSNFTFFGCGGVLFCFLSFFLPLFLSLFSYTLLSFFVFLYSPFFLCFLILVKKYTLCIIYQVLLNSIYTFKII